VIAGPVVFCETFLLQRQAVLDLLWMGANGVTIAIFVRGKRRRYAAEFLIIFALFNVIAALLGRFAPGLICLANKVHPVVSTVLYSCIASAYSTAYTPLILWFWSRKQRADTPELGLHLQLAIIFFASEALYFGGLVQLVNRYPDESHKVFMAIASRTVMDLLNRTGLGHYIWSRVTRGTSEMTPARDLYGRHASSTSWVVIWFVSPMAVGALALMVLEAVEDVSTNSFLLKAELWRAMLAAIAANLFLEVFVASLSWRQLQATAGRSDHSETSSPSLLRILFSMSEPGMQPHLVSLRKPYALQRCPMEVRDAPLTDSCHPYIFLQPKQAMIATAIAVSLSLGPMPQTMSIITDATGSVTSLCQ